MLFCHVTSVTKLSRCLINASEKSERQAGDDARCDCKYGISNRNNARAARACHMKHQAK